MDRLTGFPLWSVDDFETGCSLLEGYGSGFDLIRRVCVRRGLIRKHVEDTLVGRGAVME